MLCTISPSLKMVMHPGANSDAHTFLKVCYDWVALRMVDFFQAVVELPALVTDVCSTALENNIEEVPYLGTVRGRAECLGATIVHPAAERRLARSNYYH